MIRALTFAWLLCLTFALWIAALTPQAGGYELSLMDAYPAFFWAATVGASACSALILLMLASRREESRWWVSGALGVMLTNMFVLSLPLFRGYPVADRADALNHIGYAADIIRTGTLTELDFYPGMHFLQVAIQTVAGATPGEALIIINLAFSALWTAGIVMLVRRLAGDMRAAYLAAAFSAPFVLLAYHSFVLPSTLSAMLVPLLLALHMRRSATEGMDRAATVIAELLLAFLLVYFHPMTTLYVMALLVGFEAASRLYTWLRRRKGVATPEGTQTAAMGLQQTLGMVSILGVAFFTWSFSFSAITKNFATVVKWLMGENDRASAVGEVVGLLQVARLSLPDLVKIIGNAFGLPVLALIASVVGVGVLLWTSRKKLLSHTQFTYISAFVVAIVVTGGMFFVSSSERHPIRLLRIILILGLCGLAWWCWEAFFRRPSSVIRLAAGLTGVALLIMVGLGQMNVYANPRNGQANPQVTQAELAGMEWLVTNRQGTFTQASILPEYVPRFEAYFEGYKGLRARKEWWEKEIWLPTHFYKPDWDCMAQIAPGEITYLALSDAGRIGPMRFPEGVRDMAHIYTEADWQRLDGDRSLSKLYDNGAFEVWKTDGGAECR